LRERGQRHRQPEEKGEDAHQYSPL
jgi:hypothetical protein